MTQSPVFPSLMPNLEYMECYMDSLENLPLDVQRYVSQIREYDVLYSKKLETISRYLCLYEKEDSGPSKRKYLNKIQKCLIKSQQYADEKLSLYSQIVDLVDNRSQQLSKELELSTSERKEEEPRAPNPTSNNNNPISRIKVEKKTTIPAPEKTTRAIDTKPKRLRRGRALDKAAQDRSTQPNSKIDFEDEEEPMEEEEEMEYKPKKELKRKERDVRANNREKEKENQNASKDDDKKEEKKYDTKKEKPSIGSNSKVVRKANNKSGNSKIKKKKKNKEKEIVPEDIPFDPDEPTYCVCNRVSYGDMIGCDNLDCKIEWFHFGCVNLTHKPKGKWYCPRCTIERKEKSRK